MTHKLSTGFTPFHLVYVEDAMMPANVLFPSIQMMECLGVHDEFQMDILKEAMHDLFINVWMTISRARCERRT